MSPQFEKSCLVFVAALCLLASSVVLVNVSAQKPPATAPPKTPPVASQTNPQPSAPSDNAMSTGDVLVSLAFHFLKPNLPPGTWPSSGFRTAQDQLEIIRYDAKHEGLPDPGNMTVNDEKTWRPTLEKLRALDYIIADPGKSPHSNRELIVLDLSGPDLSKILKGCKETADSDLIQLGRTIKEHKNVAVHVELQITKQALASLNVNPLLLQKRDDDRTLRNQIVKGESERIQQELDPEKRATRLKDLQGMVDYGDQAYVALQAQIESSNKDAKELARNESKQALLRSISEARQQKDWAVANKKAMEFAEFSPAESNTLVRQIDAQENYENAMSLAYPKEEPDDQCDLYDQCKDALRLVEKAIETLHSSPPLQAELEERLQKTLKTRIDQCWSKFILRTVLWVMASLCLLISLFFAFRPGKLILHCEDGDQHGESFALDQPEIIIGSLGEPDGRAQIVINDRKRKISREHCFIKQSGRRFYLKDLDSANGTWVNGRRLEKGEYHELKKGDEILLANAATLIVRRR